MDNTEQEVNAKDTGMCPHMNFPATCAVCREARERSWQSIDAFIARLDRTANPEVMQRVEKLEPKDAKEATQMAQEVLGVISKAEEFDPEESVSLPTQALNLRERITNTYIHRNEKGKAVSLVDSINIVVPGAQGQPDKLMFTTWYVAKDKKHKGDSGTKEMYVRALKDYLAEAKSRQMEALGIAGETEPDVQLLFNRFGTKRMYMKSGERAMAEVGYVAPPEDESTAGVPEHFMIYLADGRNEMSTQELMQITRAVHAQYTRDEFFTLEHLKKEAEYANILPAAATEQTARAYQENYKRIAQTATDQVESSLKASVDGKISLLSARELKAARSSGIDVKEIVNED